MKVTWILNGCGLEGKGITGGPVRFHEISRRWGEFGVEQSLITTSGGVRMLSTLGASLPATLVRASLFLRREWFRAFRLWSYVLSAFSGRRLAGVMSPGDVVVTVSDYFCDIIPALRFKRRTSCRWVAWIHHRETPPQTRPGNRIANALTYKMQEWSLAKIAREADSAWVYDTDAGELLRSRLLELGMDSARIRVMRCGVNLDEIRKAPFRRPDTDAVMIGVRPNKGLYDIIPVWEKILLMRPGTTLRLMGGMSGESEVLARIERKGLGRVISVLKPRDGFFKADEYYEQMKSSRILFAPSHEEGWGMAVCEAMAAGIPVVAYDLPVYRRIYGDAFKKVACFDTDAFARAIVSILDSEAEFEDYRSRGELCAKSFGWQAVADSDLEALKSLVESGGASCRDGGTA